MFSQNKPLSQNGGNHLHILGLHITYAQFVNTDILMQSCHVGCQYLFKGPPDYYVGERDLVKGVSGLLALGLVKVRGWCGVVWCSVLFLWGDMW